MNKETEQEEFYERYKDIPPAVLAMIWVDIEEMLEARDKELIEKIEKIEIPYGCLQVKEQINNLLNLIKQ